MVQALRSGLHYPPKDIEAEIDAIYARKATMKEIMENKKSNTKNKSNC